MVRKLKNVENETQILFDQESDFNYSKTWKMRYAHWWTWIMVRKLKNVGNETQIMYDLASVSYTHLTLPTRDQV